MDSGLHLFLAATHAKDRFAPRKARPSRGPQAARRVKK
jgi:hypothetical protein